MKSVTLLWLVLTIGIFSCTKANRTSLQAVTHGNNAFSSRLYDVIRKPNKENLIVSPISVATVLAMLQTGARGLSSDAIQKTCEFPADNQLHPGYQSLLQQFRSDENITLEMVNKIYPAIGYQLNPQFTNTLKTYYSAEPHQLNFTLNVESAKVINSFVENATHNKIHDLIKSSDLGGGTRLVLVNAIYFKGKWKNPFPKQATQKMDFYTRETDSIRVDMMKLESKMLFADIQELEAKAVSLPYKGDRSYMLILVPNKRTGLFKMEDKLKHFPLEKIVEKLKKRKVELYLPKFKLESTINLKDHLTELGLGNIFSPTEANLSGIPDTMLNQTQSLFVSKAVQKAFIEVNEEGSEAAAATGLTIAFSSAPSSPPPIVKADHPFISIIFVSLNTTEKSLSKQTPLFYARVVSEFQD